MNSDSTDLYANAYFDTRNINISAKDDLLRSSTERPYYLFFLPIFPADYKNLC